MKIVIKFLFLKIQKIKYVLNNNDKKKPYIIFENKFEEKFLILSSIKLCCEFKRKGGSNFFIIYIKYK